ncbi:MAG TPA: rRNA maturation RNase YbeY [Candidatus Methylacidiphilales bacterium]|nr:rRNA maturation RNase YbeY [Candidatus Methylacidiphilales bacterium]
MAPPVRLSISNRQRKHRLPPRRKLQRQLELVAELIQGDAGPIDKAGAAPSPLPADIEIHFVGNATMCDVHAQFLYDPTPTDVITFPYGEILVCPEVAVGQAPLFNRSFAEETLLYAIHGLLHLAAYDDKSPEVARIMHRRQDELLAQVLKLEPFDAA